MDTIAASSFATLLRRYRLVAGLTQEGLAERAGLSARAVSDLERGLRTAPRRDTIELLADALSLLPPDRSILHAAVSRQRGPTPPRALPSHPAPGSPSVGGVHEPALLGRETELALLADVLSGKAGERAVLLVGEPGIGKTTIWEAGTEAARSRGMLVLSARPAAIEADFSFAGLADLLEVVGPGVPATLPAPQRRALDVALLRAEPGPVPPEPRAIATALLGVLRALAARQSVLVAVDDIQWLDDASAQALAFAARRLERDRVCFLLARRAGEGAALETAPTDPVRIELTGLSLGAVRSLLLQRLGVRPSRRLLRQIVEAGGGNPMFALEVGRMLVAHGLPAAGEELPIPDAVSDLVGVRVAGLPPGVRRVLLAVALGHGLGRAQLVAVADAASVEEALASGVLVIEGERMRAAHPLLATAARGSASEAAQRALHRALADVVADDERRARHLALGADGVDARLAAQVASAATRAAARGATADATDLSAHALRLTPPQAQERSERVLVLAERLLTVGELDRAAALLEAELAGLPPGEPRAIAHLLLSHAKFHHLHVDQSGAYLEQALEESPPGSMVRAWAAISWAGYLLAGRVERIGEAERLATEMLPAAEREGGQVAQDGLRVLSLARTMRGRAIDDLCGRLVSVSIGGSWARRMADRLAARGQVREARTMYHRLLTQAEELDETWSSVWLQFQLCELELRAGDWDAAAQLLRDLADSPSRSMFDDPGFDRCRALLEAGRGQVAETEQWAARTLDACEGRGLQWNRLEALRARGLAALLAHEAARAAESFSAVWDHTEREGVEEPGMFPVAPDLVEALMETGRTDRAHAVTIRLRTLAEGQEHPWGLASATRCEALLALVGGRDREAPARLAAAAADYAALGLRFDHARTLLAAGRGARRLRMWGVARELLEQSAAAFAVMGSGGWEAEACSEITRIGGRSPEGQEGLSPAERQVVALAADGLTNKEIAERLVVSVYTVERHLTHAYAKLGVRSRTHLAHRPSGPAQKIPDFRY